MKRLVFDIETDGLLNECTCVWVICAIDLDTGDQVYWKPFEGEMGWLDVFQSAKLVVGHNIKGFDLVALEKLYNFRLPRSVNVHDTMIMSLVLDYFRFGNDGHSIETWGNYLGKPKVRHEDWTKYSEDMLNRCIVDTEIQHEIYLILLEELKTISENSDNIGKYLKAEHYVSEWCARAELFGWPFDVKTAMTLKSEMEKSISEAYEKIQPLLGYRAVPRDQISNGGEKWDQCGRYIGAVAVKRPKWTKKGCYDASTASWFNVDPWSGFEGEERPICGEFCRVEFKQLSLSSVSDVKYFLFRHGWEPTDWNIKTVLDEDTGKFKKVKTSPKITEESLEAMQGNGKLYQDYLATKSRHAILESWLENVDSNGNLHGSCFPIGTPSMRARHSIIVNVPSADAAWGVEMRKLFICKPGWVLIGCDSSSNQARGLAHYLKNDEFTNQLLSGDIHTYNANILTNVLKTVLGIDHEVSRGVAKRILYAFLFGASGAKLWFYIFGVLDSKRGNKLKDGFLKAVPGFSILVKKLENIFGHTQKTGRGYIPSLAGNKIYVDSFHKLLVYLLQSCEKITCSAALMLTVTRLEEAGIPYLPCIMMHDEIDFQVPEEFSEIAREIGKKAFHDGPALFGIEIMDGDGKIGKNWYDVH